MNYKILTDLAGINKVKYDFEDEIFITDETQKLIERNPFVKKMLPSSQRYTVYHLDSERKEVDDEYLEIFKAVALELKNKYTHFKVATESADMIKFCISNGIDLI